MAFLLDQIVPWGRSRREYELMFSLSRGDLASTVLDCGGGPASFAAEMAADGFQVVSADPIYAFSGGQIRERFEAARGPIMAGVLADPAGWVWHYHRNPDGLLAHRRAALERFLGDYEAGRRAGRYLAGELPALPFRSGAFGLALCSHLLFLYSDALPETFHIRALLELCRVAQETRIFPLLTLRRGLSPHLPAARTALAAAGWSSEIVPVDYEFQRGGNQMLRIFQP